MERLTCWRPSVFLGLVVVFWNVWISHGINPFNSQHRQSVPFRWARRWRGGEQYQPPVQEGPFTADALQSLMRARCNSEGASIWVYEGSLYDPSNGNKIATVEGLELVRYLGDHHNPQGPDSSSSSSSSKRFGDLSIRSVLFPTRALGEQQQEESKKEQKEWDYAGTVLSRKLFCYRAPDNDRTLLSKIRFHPKRGATRKIATHEAVALYDTATTFVSRNHGRDMAIHTEWPSGQCIMAKANSLVLPSSTTATTTGGVSFGGDFLMSDPIQRLTGLWNRRGRRRQSQRSSFDFTVYAKRQQQERGTSPSLPPLTIPQGELIVSPPRSKLIQFGPDPASSNHNYRYGARETYSYSMEWSKPAPSNDTSTIATTTITNTRPSSSSWVDTVRNGVITKFGGDKDDRLVTEACSVRYTRYGECPPWYGVGKMCTLELVGHRVPSVRDAPPLAATLAAERVPGFLSVNTPLQSQDDETAAQAVQWFRGRDGSLPLRITEDDSEPITIDRRARLIATGKNIFERVQAATTGGLTPGSLSP